MTLEQLKAHIDLLIENGKGKYPVYFRDGPMSYPVSRVLIDKLLDKINVILLKD